MVQAGISPTIIAPAVKETRLTVSDQFLDFANS